MLRKFQFGDQLARTMKGVRSQNVFDRLVRWHLCSIVPSLEICGTLGAQRCLSGSFLFECWENKAKENDRAAPCPRLRSISSDES